MKKNVTLFGIFGIAVLITAIVFSFAACKHDSDDTPLITSVEGLGTWLEGQPANTAASPYHVILKVSSLGRGYDGESDSFPAGSVGKMLTDNSDKFVSLDLSGSTITSIEEGAFVGCTNLTGVILPSIVTSIGDSAFFGCTSLASVTIPSTVTSIGEFAFHECSSLASVTIPNGVTSIGDYTFRYCTSLTSVTIPNSVTSIGYDAFSGCTSLTSVTIPSGVTSIGGGTFSGCTSLASVTIPSGVTSIEDNTFLDCTSLASITIPNGVTRIGNDAFGECTSLTSVTFQGTFISGNFSTSAFYGLGDLRDKYLAEGGAGGVGTYTTTAPVSSTSTWTKS